MQLRHPAELIGLQLVRLPRDREYVEQCILPRSSILEDPLEPRESALGILEARVWLPRREQILVGLEHVCHKPLPQVVYRLLSDGIERKAGLVELFPRAALIYVVEVFQDLEAQLVAQSVAFVLDLGNLGRVLSVVFEVL